LAFSAAVSSFFISLFSPMKDVWFWLIALRTPFHHLGHTDIVFYCKT
jgi:hypothetical protein